MNDGMPAELSDVYTPKRSALKRLQSVTLTAVVGPSAAGKTTLMNAAAVTDAGLHVVISDTSRLPRPNETETNAYHFRSKADMLTRIAAHDYVQVAPSVTGDVYATLPESYGQNGVALLGVLADAVPTFRGLPFKAFRTLYVLPPDFATWWARLQRHRFAPEALRARLDEAETSLRFACADPQAQFVINDDLPRATADFVRLARGQPLTPLEQAGQARARQLAASLLDELRRSRASLAAL